MTHTTTTTTTTLPLALLHKIADLYGCITSDLVGELTQHEEGRKLQVLVRCGGKRFVCPVDCLESMIAAVEADGDYVRDVSIPAGHTLWGCLKPLMETA